MTTKFETYPDAKGERRFRSVAGSGGVAATADSYPNAAGAHAGVEAVKRVAAAATIVEG